MTTSTDQFCLSSKRKYTKKDGLFDKLRVHSLDKHIVYPEEDVVEFLRRLKEFLNEGVKYNIIPRHTYKDINNKIDKLAGEKLTK